MALDTLFKIAHRYEILGELGRGGMGVVYKANDLKMDRLVAIKVMTTHSPGQEYQERFLREAKSIIKMHHPNIVVVHDYGYHGGTLYMVMEYVEGVPLDKIIASRVSLTPLAKVDYIVQICYALHYAHQQGIVHRDVKPGNIMIVDGGRRLKLLDFGIARVGGTSNLSKSGLAMGTISYMSPEQTKGQKDLDGRADIFSAGVVLYELLSGKPPWTGDSDYEIMTKIIHDPFPPLSGLRNYPAALDQVLERALAKDANARYQTAAKMAQALAELEAPLKELALEEALVQFENGDLLRASDLVAEILRIDTRYREAIDLRGKLQQVAQLQQRSEQVRQLRTAAEEAVGQKRYSDALAAVEQAISIDSANSELFHYRELIRHEVNRRNDIRKKLELAKRAQEINDLSTAEELVDKALDLDPTDTQARMMKSSLEQELKRQQQQQKIAAEASRVLAARAFGRAKELIQQLEVLQPDFAPVISLKKALLEGEAEEKRRVEVENVIRNIRRALESGHISQSLSVTEQALTRFPSEPRLVRLHAQVEAMRNAAEYEHSIQEQSALIQKLEKALAAAEIALKKSGTDYHLQAELEQLRQEVDRERQVHAGRAHPVEVARYPSLDIEGQVCPAGELTIIVDLHEGQGKGTVYDRIVFTPLEPGGTEFSVRTVLSCPYLVFDPGRNEGTVTVRRSEASVPFVTHCIVPSDLTNDVSQISIRATFYYHARFCGSHEKILDVTRAMAPNAGADSGSTASLSSTAEIPRTTQVLIEAAAPSPRLTVQIHHPLNTPDGTMEWTMVVSDEVREECTDLPDSNVGYMNLESQPEIFARNLLKECEHILPGDHIQFFLGLGQLIWERAPEEFRKTYEAMRNRYGTGFPIQFITDEPYIPWELMVAKRYYHDNPEHPFLSQLHPVGRWLLQYEGRRRYRLVPGHIATVAPRYDNGGPPPPVLPQAQIESTQIQTDFGAIVIPVGGQKEQVLELLRDKRKVPIGIFHFAGHGDARIADADFSRILLEQGQELTVLEVRAPNILLGERYHTLAFFNACRVGQTNQTLGVVGGWAEALTNKHFGGFIAPLWAIYDDDAALVSTSFIRSVVTNKMEIAEALRQIRYEFADRSPTYLSYVFYGDVRAQFVSV